VIEPNSILLVVLVFLAAAGLLVVLVWRRHIVIKVAAGVVALALATFGGMALVNDYYGYYQTWGQLGADLTGNYSQFTSAAIGNRSDAPLHGKVISLRLSGRESGINRGGYVYLPPQYFQKQYAHTRFPVVELLHGSPSYAASWLVHLHADQLANQLISKHLMGPMVLVMPQTYTGNTYEECLNSARGLDDTYLTYDVRHDIEGRFRVSTDPARWGLIGVSSGGYCAANLALRHRAMFGAAGIMSGYFRPQDGPAAQILGDNPAAEADNDPLLLARKLTFNSSPLPAFWLSAGTGAGADIAGARAFAAALHGVERVSLYREPGGGHNFYAFGPAFERVLPWAWMRLAPPDLRVRFPIAGGVTQRKVSVAPTSRVPTNARHYVPPASEAITERSGAAASRARSTAPARVPNMPTHTSSP
jgi:enterochelin esterase-like enzyme